MDLWDRYEMTERLASIFGKRLYVTPCFKVYRWLGRNHYKTRKPIYKD